MHTEYEWFFRCRAAFDVCPRGYARLGCRQLEMIMALRVRTCVYSAEGKQRERIFYSSELGLQHVQSKHDLDATLFLSEPLFFQRYRRMDGETEIITTKGIRWTLRRAGNMSRNYSGGIGPAEAQGSRPSSRNFSRFYRRCRQVTASC